MSDILAVCLACLLAIAAHRAIRLVQTGADWCMSLKSYCEAAQATRTRKPSSARLDWYYYALAARLQHDLQATQLMAAITRIAM
jgi:hypothetical protein